MKQAWNEIHLRDVVEGLKQIEDNSTDCVLIDPPYNIGYDFGNNKCKKDILEYISWSNEWIAESKRILKPSGTMFIYGFSEVLAHLSVNLEMNHRWLVWHYTNKSVPAARFWQRSHESILCAWHDKKERVYNLDSVREPYTETFLKNAAGRSRKATKGRFSSGKKETLYTAHKGGALPRDVIKISALAGGAGAKSRISYCSDCDIALLGKQDNVLHSDHHVIKHPTQKPFDLTKRLLLSCMPPEGKVVVPFSGTGSECLVAKKLNMEFIGFDLNPDYVKMGNSITKRENIII